MRIICDGHEYRVRDSVGGYIAKNNYGTDVAFAHKSVRDEYWRFICKGASDFFHKDDSMFEGRSVKERLVQWYAAVSS